MKRKQVILWIVTVIFSLIYLIVGNKIATNGLSVLSNEGSISSRAKVMSIDDTIRDTFSLDGITAQTNITTIFTCEILDGDFKGKKVQVLQTEDAFAPVAEKTVEVGDEILILNNPTEYYPENSAVSYDDSYEQEDPESITDDTASADQESITDDTASEDQESIADDTAPKDADSGSSVLPEGEEIYEGLIEEAYPDTEIPEGIKIDWVFNRYVRFDTLIYFALFFFALILLFGRSKGINTIISLAFTCAAVFLVYIPSILNGHNIYVSTLINCAFISLMSLLMITGWSRKTAATVLGCMFGFLVASLLSIILSAVLELTGFVDEHSIYLTYLPTETPIDLKAIIFGGVVIGSLGAVIDVSMDISSSLYELRRHAKDLPFNELVKSGISIGRDIIGTMANTLVLAYIGSALSTVLLLTTYAVSIEELLNRELIIAELMQALVGSTAILLTIPLTSIICGFMYSKKQKAQQSANELKNEIFLQ